MTLKDKIREILEKFGNQCIKNGERYMKKIIDTEHYQEVCKYDKDQALTQIIGAVKEKIPETKKNLLEKVGSIPSYTIENYIGWNSYRQALLTHLGE